MSLKVDNLSFKFGEKVILKDISFGVKSGEIVGILGPNGCGKSTILKNILQIYKPSSGIIKLENKKIDEYSLKELSKIIGFVPQKSALSMPLLVEEIILMGRYSHMKNAFSGYSIDDLKAVDEIITKLDLNKFKKRIANSLSGGEFQRVILARALVSNPEFLLLDEPTSALDLNFSVQILKFCRNLAKNSNIKCVLVLHDLNLASLICDKVAMVKNGKIKYFGEPNKLFNKEILKEIYDLDCEIINHKNRPVVIAN
ncbi:heme ABC transporter ChuBCD, ATP-binding protein [Campylobacter blaseri]|uniref:Heme ABC transporter ATP-binding protein n=1 Tax=Campylobacter blaseri TaxID=2042961 RepID=A0A2P8R438_9BACT|nr:ABC transporter ATP-binding protein [Campylobacter blaseri]PSM53235.1 heme ABC transporter ATP-binding protein [Campylobacter blaseri]PSM54701.1 heme ABC transporter ATP-binding protein [Campylobacter blaseri]QKF86816.1 heme ABC transporter ChuBCD, ATP-binding protein [Campylobacter blaseri]